MPGDEVAHGNSTPPPNGIPGTNQPGLPRKASEIRRATASYKADSCESEDQRQTHRGTFGGAGMGIFAGRLQYTVYKGTNLIRQEVIAKTDEQSVAYMFDAGLKGVGISRTEAEWRDTANKWQQNPSNRRSTRSRRRRRRQPTAGGERAPDRGRVPTAAQLLLDPRNPAQPWLQLVSQGQPPFGTRSASASPRAKPTRGMPDTDRKTRARTSRCTTPGPARGSGWRSIARRRGAAKAASSRRLPHAKDHYKAVQGYLVMARHFHTSPVSRLLASKVRSMICSPISSSRRQRASTSSNRSAAAASYRQARRPSVRDRMPHPEAQILPAYGRGRSGGRAA